MVTIPYGGVISAALTVAAYAPLGLPATSVVGGYGLNLISAEPYICTGEIAATPLSQGRTLKSLRAAHLTPAGMSVTDWGTVSSSAYTEAQNLAQVVGTDEVWISNPYLPNSVPGSALQGFIHAVAPRTGPARTELGLWGTNVSAFQGAAQYDQLRRRVWNLLGVGNGAPPGPSGAHMYIVFSDESYEIFPASISLINNIQFAFGSRMANVGMAYGGGYRHLANGTSGQRPLIDVRSTSLSYDIVTLGADPSDQQNNTWAAGATPTIFRAGSHGWVVQQSSSVANPVFPGMSQAILYIPVDCSAWYNINLTGGDAVSTSILAASATRKSVYLDASGVWWYHDGRTTTVSGQPAYQWVLTSAPYGSRLLPNTEGIPRHLPWYVQYDTYPPRRS